MKTKKELNLTEGNIFKSLLVFVIPIMLGSLIQQLYVTVDAVIVGQYVGKIGLAAIDSVHTLFKFPLNFMNGLSAGITIMLSKFYGAKDNNGVNYAIRTALNVALVLGIIFSIFGVIFTPNLLDIMSVPSDIYEQTFSYTRMYFVGIWAMVLYNIFSGILRAMGDSKRPLYILVVCSVLNIVGDFICVNILHMDTMGAALATVIAQIVSAVLTFILVARTQIEAGRITFLHLSFKGEYYANMIKVGLPLAIQSLLFPIANSVVQASVNTMGTNEIAAWGLCGKLDMLIWLIADSMNPAMITYIAQNVGAKKADRVKKGALIGTSMSVIGVAVISVILFFGIGFMGPWFINAKDVADIVPLAVNYMHIMAPFYIFYAIGESLSGVCCSMGDTIKPMILTLSSICLFRVIGIIFVLPHFGTMHCIVWIYVLSWIAVATVFSILFAIRSRNVHKLIEKAED